jgi:Zn-dependent peptidase ImmA (M78 family)
VHNESHSQTRQASNITHELSHCLLEHPPGPAVSRDGCRHWNDRLEAEADWLAGALLVPREGALYLLGQGMSVDSIAQHFGVSPALGRRRIYETGVAKQSERLSDLRRSRGWPRP